jgi:hypothetical protein
MSVRIGNYTVDRVSAMEETLDSLLLAYSVEKLAVGIRRENRSALERPAISLIRGNSHFLRSPSSVFLREPHGVFSSDIRLHFHTTAKLRLHRKGVFQQKRPGPIIHGTEMPALKPQSSRPAAHDRRLWTM